MTGALYEAGCDMFEELEIREQIERENGKIDLAGTIDIHPPSCIDNVLRECYF